MLLYVAVIELTIGLWACMRVSVPAHTHTHKHTHAQLGQHCNIWFCTQHQHRTHAHTTKDNISRSLIMPAENQNTCLFSLRSFTLYGTSARVCMCVCVFVCVCVSVSHWSAVLI